MLNPNVPHIFQAKSNNIMVCTCGKAGRDAIHEEREWSGVADFFWGRGPARPFQGVDKYFGF